MQENMNGMNGNVQAMNTGNNNEGNWQPVGNWADDMTEEAKKGGKFFKMELKDEKSIVIKSERPLKGISNFKTDKGNQKTAYRLMVLVEGEQEAIQWEFANRQIMEQLAAIGKRFKLQSLMDCKLLVKTQGETNKDKKWTLTFVCSPTVVNPAFQQLIQGAAAPSQVLPNGQDWIEGQKAGAQ